MPAGLVVILFQKKFSSEQKANYSKLIIICFSPQRAEGLLFKIGCDLFFPQRAEGLPGEGEGGAVGEGGVDESG